MNAASNESTTATLENEAYRQLLNRSTADILKETRWYRDAIKKQSEVLKDWVISQEAFRSLTGQFRKQLGISDEEIMRMVAEEHATVLARYQQKEDIK